MSEEHKGTRLAVIGNTNQVLPFRAIGADTREVDNDDDARAALEEMVENYVIIIISDDFWKGCGDVISRYSGKAVPAIISMPGEDGTTGSFSGMLNSLVRRAIGIDIPGGIGQ